MIADYQIQAQIIFPVAPPEFPVVKRVRKYGDPIMVAEAGADVTLTGVSNFQAIGLYNKVAGWGGVSNPLKINREDIDYLHGVQRPDQFGYTPEQKMNWLVKPLGTIFFTKDINIDWQTASQIFWGTIALGGNFVTVEGYEDTIVNINGTMRLKRMAKLAGFRKSDMGKPIDELVAIGKMNIDYCAYLPNNKFGFSPKGVVFSPFYSPLDWDMTGSSVRAEAFYLPDDWLE